MGFFATVTAFSTANALFQRRYPATLAANTLTPGVNVLVSGDWEARGAALSAHCESIWCFEEGTQVQSQQATNS
jgi:hypothetical protein